MKSSNPSTKSETTSFWPLKNNSSSSLRNSYAIDFATQQVGIAVTAFQIMPDDTVNPNHLDCVQKLLRKYGEQLFKKHKYSDDDDEIDWSLQHHFSKKLARFLLHRDVQTIESWLQLIAPVFGVTDTAANFLSDLVSAEIELGRYDSFWAVWEGLFPAIKKLSSKRGYRDLDTIISNYLLAWPWWGNESKEWKSLRDREKTFFIKACKEMGAHPEVLYSVSKLLNEIGSAFLEDGVLWIADMLSEHKNLHTEELQVNTVYYLEKIARRFIYLNRTKLRANRILKDKVMVLLDFLMNKESVIAYLLREDIY